MSGDLIPEEAVEAGADALLGESADKRDDLYDDMRAVLEAAAPLILAADLDRQAAVFDLQADALEAPRMGTPASGMVTVLRDLAEDARGRAAQLRVEGGEQG